VPVVGSSFRSGNDLNLDLFEGEGRQTFPFFVGLTLDVAHTGLWRATAPRRGARTQAVH
jgi:hypothetical protein